MNVIADPVDRALLDDWQRDFPVSSRPFTILAEALGQSEQSVLERLERMRSAGRITRVGATCAPNSISASTLAAVAALPEDVDKIATIIGEEPGVNHSYHREDKWNLWFVVTGPDRAFVDAALTRISERTGLRVLDLRLLRPFNVDLGFRMSGTDGPGTPPAPRPIDLSVIRSGDTEILQSLSYGLPIVSQPFAALAANLGRSESEILGRIDALSSAGIISRLGVIVRHRALGWRSNAMVVWDIEPERIEAAGPVLAAQTGVTLCYERRPVQGIWPYRLYCMIHARSRDEALKHLSAAETLAELSGVPYKVLFSTRCFKQTGALIARKPERAA
jgi:DNA-binding Lrp family transcriptional regulator